MVIFFCELITTYVQQSVPFTPPTSTQSCEVFSPCYRLRLRVKFGNYNCRMEFQLLRKTVFVLRHYPIDQIHKMWTLNFSEDFRGWRKEVQFFLSQLPEQKDDYKIRTFQGMKDF